MKVQKISVNAMLLGIYCCIVWVSATPREEIVSPNPKRPPVWIRNSPRNYLGRLVPLAMTMCLLFSIEHVKFAVLHRPTGVDRKRNVLCQLGLPGAGFVYFAVQYTIHICGQHPSCSSIGVHAVQKLENN